MFQPSPPLHDTETLDVPLMMMLLAMIVPLMLLLLMMEQSCGSEDLFFLGPKQGFLVNGIYPMPCAIADVGVIVAHDHQEVPDLVFRGVEDVVSH